MPFLRLHLFLDRPDRCFVVPRRRDRERITIDGVSQRGKVQMRRLSAPDVAGAGSSLQVVAGVRCEAQQMKRDRETEVVRVRFEIARSTGPPAQTVQVVQV